MWPDWFMTPAASGLQVLLHTDHSHLHTQLSSQYVEEVLVDFKVNANVDRLIRGPKICTRTPKDPEIYPDLSNIWKLGPGLKHPTGSDRIGTNFTADCHFWRYPTHLNAHHTQTAPAGSSWIRSVLHVMLGPRGNRTWPDSDLWISAWTDLTSRLRSSRSLGDHTTNVSQRTSSF